MDTITPTRPPGAPRTPRPRSFASIWGLTLLCCQFGGGFCGLVSVGTFSLLFAPGLAFARGHLDRCLPGWRAGEELPPAPGRVAPDQLEAAR